MLMGKGVACNLMRSLTKARQFKVCVLSPHPIALEEFRRQLSHGRFHLLLRRLDSTLALEPRRLLVPRARVYVLDAMDRRPVTEALVAGILERFPRARLLVVAEKLGETNVFALLRLGVRGLVTHVGTLQQLGKAVQLVAAGGYWVPRSILSRFVDTILHRSSYFIAKKSTRFHLTPRKQEILQALLENLSNKEIASKLNISLSTVKFHISELLTEHDVRRRADLILFYWQGGAISARAVA